ncbi:MAG: TIGR01212 family radical SAM protein [Lachnospiraceae bacterium]|nr:TIGR01212 family radical SAM protein [Lachnospiraceae bacterium]MBQ8262199.1 TIGR01212 family radical SAM protein [Lachnospiraceae bacterium]
MEKRVWDSKPYNSLNYYFQNRYGEKIYKIALDGGMTCPNRDGVIDTRGCIFCSRGGSGEFAVPIDREHPDIRAQLEEGKKRLASKYAGAHFVAYFQPYTNTYAPITYLEEIYTAALEEEMVVGISIATRPDCLSLDVLNLLRDLKERYPEKFIWVELGLQTIHRETARYIRRGYETSVFEEAVRKLQNLQIPVIVHVILGLPGETRQHMLSTVEYLNTFPIFGIKLQLLHVLENTDLAVEFENRVFDVLTMEEYINIVIECLEVLSPDLVIHRLTGDGPKESLIAPTWSTNKKKVLNTLLGEMKTRDSWQGKRYENTSSFHVI